MINYSDTVIFNNEERVNALFTQKNSTSVNCDGQIPGLNLGLNTKAENSETDSNYLRLLEDLHIDLQSVARARQVHGTNVLEVQSGGLYADYDALVTSKPGMTLAIQVADCMALLIADCHTGIVGAVHAGWRGAIDGIVLKTVGHLVNRSGSDPGNLKVYVSPSICCDHFEVGEEVAIRFPEQFVYRESYSKPHIDLKKLVYSQLVNQGISDENIYLDPHCTWKESDLYYSFRRENEHAGRMLALITLNY